MASPGWVATPKITAMKSANHALEVRLRKAIGPLSPIVEKRMFGGICFLWRKHMLCGTGKSGFLFRVGKENDSTALARPGAKPMIHAGRRMAGFVWVSPDTCDRSGLAGWIEMSRRHVAGLPAKSDGQDRGRKRNGRPVAGFERF